MSWPAEYSSDELEILDSIEMIRERWRMFFHVDGIFDALALLARLAEDPALLGAKMVSTNRVGDWFVVCSSIDWLPDEERSTRTVPNRAFEEVTPFVANGQNSFHYITYIAALADKLISMSSTRYDSIVGTVETEDPIWTVDRHCETVRTIAYTIDENKFWG